MHTKPHCDRPDGPASTTTPPGVRLAHGLAAGLCLLFALGATACGEPSVSQYNFPPSLTSIGPVSYDGSSVLVDYAIRDREGDDQSVYVGVCSGSGEPDGRCPSPVQGVDSDGRTFLPTVPRGTDVRHVFAWNIGCGRVQEGECLETKPDEQYHFRIRLKGTDDMISSEKFTIAEEFGTDSIPACDTSAGEIPPACSPDDGGGS